MTPETRYAWERLPEYQSTQQFARCLGRLLVSLPRRIRRKAESPLTRSATLVATSIAGANAVADDEGRPTVEERKGYCEAGLQSIDACREGLEILRDSEVGSRADLLAAFELLERVEAGLKGKRDRLTASQQ